MKIASPVVGELDVSPDRILTFPAGLPGFESNKQFTLLHAEGEAPKLFLLQGVDESELVFSVTTPDCLGLNYEFALSDEEVGVLQLADPADATVLLIVRHEENCAPGESPLRANLMAPLVLNTTTRRGLQKIIGRIDCDVTLRAIG